MMRQAEDAEVLAAEGVVGLFRLSRRPSGAVSGP